MEDKSADFPPGNSLSALEDRCEIPSPSLPNIVFISKPSENPLAKERPMLTPSSIVSEKSIPSKVIIPNFKPLPIPSPMSPMISANFPFPLFFHHFEKGSTINSSHAIFIFPTKSAFSHSSVFLI